MLTGDIRAQVDRIWDTFWSGGIANPLEVIEQITYLLFIKRLDDLQRNAERAAAMTGTPIERRIFPDGADALRWSHLKELDAKTMYAVVSERVFPFIRTLGGDGST